MHRSLANTHSCRCCESGHGYLAMSDGSSLVYALARMPTLLVLFCNARCISHTHTDTHTHMYIYIYISMQASVCTCMDVYIYIHIYIYMLCMCMNVYMHVCLPFCRMRNTEVMASGLRPGEKAQEAQYLVAGAAKGHAAEMGGGAGKRQVGIDMRYTAISPAMLVHIV
jgi:hypothetical protein